MSHRQPGPLAIVAIVLICSFPASSASAAESADRCPPATFLTFEHGKLAAVDFVERRGTQLHTRAVETQSHIIDAVIDLRPDETASHSSVVLQVAGEEPDQPLARDLGEGAIYWSPRIPSSIEQAILRSRVLGTAKVKLPAASLFSSSRTDISVEEIDAVDWVVTYHDRSYRVLSDTHGCMLAATLPEFGVMIERQIGYSAQEYPLWSPYAPPPDHAYRAEEIKISAAQGYVLVGTLTSLFSKNAAPAAVLITGLSPHERNNGEAPWMPFRDIADALTRAGIAVLRVDDRGIGKSSGNSKTYTTYDKLDDVATEVAWLRSRADIDPRRIMLVGYSEGGLIAAMAAAKDHSIAAIVSLDGPGVPGLAVARYQVAQPILRDPSIADSEKPSAVEKAYIEALKDLSPHESTFLQINPEPYDRQVHCPALIIHGGADATVPIRSAERIAEAMRANGNRDVTVRIFPGVSHSMLPDPSGLPSGWAALPGFLTAPEILEEITRWSLGVLKSR